MTEEVLQKLIEFIENASPTIWNAFMKQVYVDIFTDVIWSIIFILILIVLLRFASYYKKMLIQERKDRSTDHNEDEWYSRTFLCYLLAGVVALIPSGLLISAFRLAINPTFYAIKNILTLISGD